MITNEYEESINQIKENLDKAKSLRIRAEARLEQLNRQKQDILKEIESLGVKPDELEKEIERLKKEIEEMIKTANELLPADLIEDNR